MRGCSPNCQNLENDDLDGFKMRLDKIIEARSISTGSHEGYALPLGSVTSTSADEKCAFLSCLQASQEQLVGCCVKRAAGLPSFGLIQLGCSCVLMSSASFLFPTFASQIFLGNLKMKCEVNKSLSYCFCPRTSSIVCGAK